MPTAVERLRHVTAKLDRAKQHMQHLERLHHTFLKSNPYKVATKRDPQTKRLIYYVSAIDQPMGDFSTTVGDVLQNLVSTLDHLAYQLVCIGMGSEGPFDHVYFPFADTAAKYQSKAPQKVKGMRPNAIIAIDGLKPYKGGNDSLWRLYKLNNVDKHRLLITVGSAFRSVNIGALLHKSMQEMWNNKGASFPPMDFYLKPADRLFPLKIGDELFIDGPDAEENEKMQFVFEVAFGEPKIVEGEPLLETLHQMTKVVDGIIPSFVPLLV